ncbi:hypothetical protein [Parasitella parasitica]|uniref:Nudix hydrolase domain-containing protein n=1 Tax=Parasitella parasitica TaxID=35722 RepID=A0A0B7NIL4_9FUNG|nr:hypothetical protein [Parasitella parasitica]
MVARNMSTITTAQKPLIRPSASLIIAAPTPRDGPKDGSNYRILMVKRNARSSFINAHVYPGGVVDTADHYTNWSQDKSISESEGNILTNKICAIRETFEESGLLLSHPPANTIKALDANVWRHKVHNDASQFKIMCDTFAIRPAVDKLIPFSNWITPVEEKKRYDTMFFLTVLEEYKTKQEQDLHLNAVSADGTETVLFDWLKPEEALQKKEEKQVVMIPPQWYSLTLMSEVKDYKDLVSQAGVGSFRTKSNQVIKILPQARLSAPESIEASEGYQMFLAYPGDETYKSTEYASKKTNRHRLYIRGRMQDFRLEKNINVSNILKTHSSNL